MAGFEDIVKKAFYMGVGFADYAQEKAGTALTEITTQAQQLADEMIARGEMNVEEARKFVDEMVQQAKQDIFEAPATETESKEPRIIEIVTEEESENTDNLEQNETPDIDDLKSQVQSLKEELQQLRQDSK
ncbi:MAG: phasin family protein [Xenococcus sp. (in: cyanobacteria)]